MPLLLVNLFVVIIKGLYRLLEAVVVRCESQIKDLRNEIRRRGTCSREFKSDVNLVRQMAHC